MRRMCVTPRNNWQAKADSIGFFYHSLGGNYWNEGACYTFSKEEIDEIEKATNELHEMCLKAVQHVIDKDLFDKLKIQPQVVPLILRSWEREDVSIYGRFDLAFDGVNPPKMLEYNADTPTALLEASIAQWQWLEDNAKGADQFNSIHERFVRGWKECAFGSRTLHFASVKESPEDLGNIEYLRDTAIEAGLKTKHIHIEDIGWNESLEKFVDLDEEPIDILFKIYPWEWLTTDSFGRHLLREPLTLIEPAWKMVLSNKGILPILWEMYPEHPNLLPSYFEPHLLGDSFVKKPLLSREGANVAIVRPEGNVETAGAYGEEGYIYQQYFRIPQFDGRTAVLGSWIVNGESAGIGIRESESLITNNLSSFVPHVLI